LNDVRQILPRPTTRYLNQLWKIVAPSSEWRLHFYNYKFWIGDHFLTSFQPTLCIVISLFFIN